MLKYIYTYIYVYIYIYQQTVKKLVYVIFESYCLLYQWFQTIKAILQGQGSMNRMFWGIQRGDVMEPNVFISHSFIFQIQLE